MKKRTAVRASLGAMAITWAVAATVANAADTWTNGAGTGVWTTGGNWADGTFPGLGDDVTFTMPGPASHALTLPGPPTAGNAQAKSLIFQDSYTLNSGTLEMPGAPITVDPVGAIATINSRVLSSTGLAKNGNGTLALGGDNANFLTGDIHINDGVLRYSSDSNLGPTFYRLYIHDTLEADTTFTSMRRMEPSNGTIRVTAGNTLTLAANDQFGFSNTDALYKDGPGTLVTTGHSSRFGPTYMLAGTTRLSNGDFGYGPYFVGNDATLECGPGQFGSGFLSNATTLGVNSVLRAVANMSANNVSGQAGVTMNSTLAAASGALFDVTLKNNPGSNTSVFHIAGPGSVRLLNTSLVYAGGWSIDSGTLRIATPTALGTGTSAIPIGSGGVLQVENTPFGRALNLSDNSGITAVGSSPVSGFLNVAPGANVNLRTVSATDQLVVTGPADRLNGGAGGTLRIGGPGKVIVGTSTAFAGDWSLESGSTLRIQNANSLGLPGTKVVFAGAATLEIGAALNVTRDIFFNDGTIRAANGNAAITGKISIGAGALVTFAALGSSSLTLGDEPNDITFGGNLGDSTINIGPNSGPIILTNSNDVKAAWVIKQSASLHISDDAQLGPLVNTRPITLDGGGAELWTLAPITTTRNIVANTGIFNSNGFDSTYGNVTGGNLAKSGEGMLAVNHVRISGALSVGAGVLKINHSGGVAAATAAGMSRLSEVDVSGTGQIDVSDNAMLITGMPAGTFNGTTYDGVAAYAAAGYDFGTWDGAGGIVTSEADAQAGLTGIGIAAAEQTPYAGGSLRGMSVSANDVVLMYTYMGDANLDGLIDGGDYGIIDNFIQVAGASGYANGDFNYDGVIDGGDYGIIDNNVQAQGAPFLVSGGIGMSIGGVSAVPEPGGLGLCLLALASMRRRRQPSSHCG